LESIRPIIKKTLATKNIPVILFTAQNNGKDNLMDVTGAQDVLFKPFNIKTLVKKIEAVT
jgi:DNA-binding response OmpR family regulator